MIANAGITRICFGEFYRDERIFRFSERLGIALVHIPLPGVALPALPPPPAA
jgi:dCMP deaminase